MQKDETMLVKEKEHADDDMMEVRGEAMPGMRVTNAIQVRNNTQQTEKNNMRCDRRTVSGCRRR